MLFAKLISLLRWCSQRRVAVSLICRMIRICSKTKTKLGSQLNKIKQQLIENGYLADVLIPCINQKLVNFTAEKPFSLEKCPVYLKLSWIGNVSSKFENQINKANTSCFYAVKLQVVYNTRAMLPHAKKFAFLSLKKVV